MPSSFTSRLKLEKQASGENSGTWGNLVNYVLNRVDASVKGYQAVNVAGSANVTLTSNNSTSNTDDSATDDQAHNAILEFTGALTANINVFTDAVETNYAVFNNTSGSFTLTFGPTGGAGVDIKQGTKTLVYTDGTTMYDITKDLGDIQVTGLTSNGGVTITGNTDVTGNIALKTQGAVVFEDSSGGEFAAIKANATTTSYSLTLPPADGTCGQVLTTDGSGNLSFADAGGGAVSWQTGSIKTANFTAVAGEGYFANTAGGAFTMTLPGSPSAGDIVAVKDYSQNFNSNNLTVARNSSNIDGNTNDVTLDNTAESITFIYVDGTQGWKVINNSTKNFAPAYVTATGGTITCCGDYKIHTFTGPGAFCVTNVGNSLGNDKISYMIVAGGGGGGSTNSTDDGAGGGAGGYREGKDACDPYTTDGCTAAHTTLGSTGAYPVVVGGGGAGGPGTPSVPGTTGSDSSFNSIISAGGGAARGSGSTEPPSIANGGSGGGSGGGGGVPGNPGGAGNTPFQTPPQGNPGGAAAQSVPDGSAGGGGGALVAGGTAGGSSAPGGGGATSSITGTPTARAGGGGGATASGVDGGGPGNGTPGTTNTGGGGGGHQNGSTAGTGGSGIVVIRYKFQN